jgi:hypothetical protein
MFFLHSFWKLLENWCMVNHYPEGCLKMFQTLPVISVALKITIWPDRMIYLPTHSLLLLPCTGMLLAMVDCSSWAWAPPVLWSLMYTGGWFGYKVSFWNYVTQGEGQSNHREFCIVYFKLTLSFFPNTTYHWYVYIHYTGGIVIKLVYYGLLQPESNVSIGSMLVLLLLPVYNILFYTLPHWSNLICSVLVDITPSQGCTRLLKIAHRMPKNNWPTRMTHIGPLSHVFY